MNSLTLKTVIFSGNNICQEYDYSKYARVLIVSDKIMTKIGLCDLVSNRLKIQNIEFCVFNDVEPNPSFDTVSNGVVLAITFKPDAIIAIGGGSVNDAAKGIIYFMQKAYKEMGKPFVKPTLIAVPTTSGAGSEVTAYAVITDKKNQSKVTLVDDLIIPDIALLDSSMTKSAPASVSAESGVDALTHILESYASINSFSFSQALCEKAIKIIFKDLITVFKNGNNLEARLAMHEAACMAGVAFTNTGLGLNHAMSHSLGARFYIPHGRANALLITHVIKYNKKTSLASYANLSRVLGLPSQNNEEAFLSLLVAIEYLCSEVAIERSVLEFKINETEYLQAIPDMAKLALADPCLTTNPAKPTLQEIEDIYRKLI